MDEKTAKIPSLKEFKDSQKDKKAQSQRSSSMQTKKQLKKSMEKSRDEQNIRKKTPQKSTVRKEARKPVSSPQRKKDAQEMSDTRERIYVRDRIEKEKTESGTRKISQKVSENHSRSNSQKSPSDLYKYRTQGMPKVRSESVKTEEEQDVPQKIQKNHKPVSHKARKFRSFVIYAAMVLFVILTGLILSLTVLFKTESIVVSGNTMYSDEDIISISGIDIGENIFLAGKKKAEENIEKAYPYVADAHVYFKLPDKIMIDITMAQPSYYIESLGGFYVVNDGGKVLEVTATDDEIDVPVIEGANVKGNAPGENVEYSSSLVATAVEEIFAAFSEHNAEKITAVNVQQGTGGSVKFRYVYDDRIVVFLGLSDNLNYKIQSATAIIRDKIDVNNSTIAGELDVSTAFDNNKCYFNEYTLLAPQIAPTENTEEVSEETLAPEIY